MHLPANRAWCTSCMWKKCVTSKVRWSPLGNAEQRKNRQVKSQRQLRPLKICREVKGKCSRTDVHGSAHGNSVKNFSSSWMASSSKPTLPVTFLSRRWNPILRLFSLSRRCLHGAQCMAHQSLLPSAPAPSPRKSAELLQRDHKNLAKKSKGSFIVGKKVPLNICLWRIYRFLKNLSYVSPKRTPKKNKIMQELPELQLNASDPNCSFEPVFHQHYYHWFFSLLLLGHQLTVQQLSNKSQVAARISLQQKSRSTVFQWQPVGGFPCLPVTPPRGHPPAAHLAVLPWLHSASAWPLTQGKAFAFALLLHGGTGNCLRPPHTALPAWPPPALGVGQLKPPSSAKHTELQIPIGGTCVFHYSPACEISPGTKLSADFPLTLNIFAEGYQRVKRIF